MTINTTWITQTSKSKLDSVIKRLSYITFSNPWHQKVSRNSTNQTVTTKVSGTVENDKHTW